MWKRRKLEWRDPSFIVHHFIDCPSIVIAGDDDWTSSPDFIDMFAPDYDSSNPHPLSDVIPQDLVAMEILPRLADSRTATRRLAVSAEWRSLLTAPDFIPNFTRRHPPPPYAMFFNFRFASQLSLLYIASHTHLVVNGSKVTTGVADYACRGPPYLILQSACDNFMLFSSPSTIRRLHLRNIVTGESLYIPELPPGGIPGGPCRLVSHPDSTASCYSFRIVVICRFSRDGGPPQYYSSIFSSETWRWSEPAEAPTLLQRYVAVAAKGLLFWLDSVSFNRLVVFDAFQESWTYVPLPGNVMLNRDFYHGLAVEFGLPTEVEQLGSTKNRLHIGAVQGRIRLAQLFRAGCAGFVLKTWELNDDHSSSKPWHSVIEVKLKPPPRGTNWVYFLSFDADDGDVVFLCCDCDVYRYSLIRGSYEKLFRLSCSKANEDKTVANSLPRFAHVFIVRLPVWHTSLPTLPFAPT